METSAALDGTRCALAPFPARFSSLGEKSEAGKKLCFKDWRVQRCSTPRDGQFQAALNVFRCHINSTREKRHMSLNRATVIGYLGQDPQLRYTPQGTPVCTLSVATDESYTNKQTGERKEAVEWHRVVVWGRQGSICAEMLAKGRQVYVEGKLSTRSYDKDGEKRYVTEIVALRVQFLGPKPNGGVAELPAADDTDIPF
jgi:single-strand DNA-binding protein